MLKHKCPKCGNILCFEKCTYSNLVIIRYFCSKCGYKFEEVYED